MQSYNQLPEQELIRLIERRDTFALAEMYNRHSQELIVHALKILRDEDDAVDAVHDVFLKVYTIIRDQKFSIHTSLEAFLHRILRNRIYDKIDKTRVSGEYFSILQQHLDMGEPTTENNIIEKETRKRIEDGIDSMPSRTRTIYKLSNLENLTQEQISEKMQISSRSVRRHLKEAFRILQEKLTSILFLL